MEPTVWLTAEEGLTPSGPRGFAAPARVLVGRAEDCDLRAPSDEKRVSRHHCVFEVEPPAVRLRDLGSRNGAHVNGAKVGMEAYELADGDEVRLAGCTVHVAVSSAFSDPPKPTAVAEPDAMCPYDGGARPWVGDHELLRLLGCGAQGVVHLARRRDSGALVALKVMRTAGGGMPGDAVHGFLREIRTARDLRHGNVVRFHEAGSTVSALYFTSEFCDGGSLADLPHAADVPGPGSSRLTTGTALDVTCQLLDGLAYAHGVPGLVHRDIKPRNLLLSGPSWAPVAKIADFGLAKAFERAGMSGQTRTGALGGSVAFMPRSQIVNYKYARPPVDVWAMAACLYWMLTRTPPRDFPPDAVPVHVVLHKAVVPVRERAAGVPPRLADLLDTILGEDEPREEVTPTASEFAARVREIA